MYFAINLAGKLPAKTTDITYGCDYNYYWKKLFTLILN